VPKFYLRPWSNTEQVFCLRKGIIKPIGLSDVGVEEDFYAVRDLTLEDIEFLRGVVIAQSPEGARPIHENLLSAFTLIAFANRVLHQDPALKDEAKNEIRKVVSNLNENYHETIERHLQDAIKCMLSGSVEFFSDALKAGNFLRSLGLFSLRTKGRRERMKAVFRIPLPGFDIDRVYSPMIHMLAVNIGGSLLVDRSRYRIVLLRNETTTSFITGDQPVINIHEACDERGIPREVEWYFPLSPKVAMLYVLVERSHYELHSNASQADVNFYNRRIVEAHHDQLYGGSEESLSCYL
jgi:hypothetical protein